MGVLMLANQRTAFCSLLARRLRAFVLLGGSVRRGELAMKIGRPVFDLPLESGHSILDKWCQEANTLAESLGSNSLQLRIMIDRSVPLQSTPCTSPSSRISVRIEQDPLEYRGTGGVLHDLARDYSDDDWLLVANAAQVLMEPLGRLVEALAGAEGDVSLISHEDGSPSGLFFLRCGVLRDLPAEGFIDMKEQALPAIAARYHVSVLQRSRPTGLPVRTLADYIHALRTYHECRAGTANTLDPYAENWKPAFAIVEDGATVTASAHLHDSVVLRGASVGADAVLAHCLICPGGTVRRREVLADKLVSGGSNKHHRG